MRPLRCGLALTAVAAVIIISLLSSPEPVSAQSFMDKAKEAQNELFQDLDREADRRRLEAEKPENVRMWNRVRCHAIKDYAPLQACLGNCSAITDSRHFGVKKMCEGECISGPTDALRLACEGNCGLISSPDDRVKCLNCAKAGRSSKWATLYAFGVTMNCN